MPPEPPSSKAPKKRGAPYGNTNALTHGLYAKKHGASPRTGKTTRLQAAEMAEMELLKLLFTRLAHLMANRKTRKYGFQLLSTLFHLCLSLAETADYHNLTPFEVDVPDLDDMTLYNEMARLYNQIVLEIASNS